MKIDLRDGECWWGGFVQDGVAMPFGREPFDRDLTSPKQSNQAAPLLVSNSGRYVWSERPFAFAFRDGCLEIDCRASVNLCDGGSTLREGFLAASTAHFPPSGAFPDPRLFSAPQYNLWIETLYEPTQEKVLAYTDALIAAGFPPGVLMIDDNWHGPYGDWRFNRLAFPDPKAMIDELHAKGFLVMLWVCNFISPDTAVFRNLRERGYLLLSEDGTPAIRRWWNGYSAILDATNPAAVDWLWTQLDKLRTECGVDGFKLDAGDFVGFRDTDISYVPTDPNGHCEAWARVGLHFTLNEYRACWKLGGQPLAQRLSDKLHSWADFNGLGSLIPNGLAQGLLGYAYTCPDMIGGGEFRSFLDHSDSLDQELFVRMAQCSALFPTMQFSAAPWRVLDDEHLAIVLQAAKIHVEHGDEILALARDASHTGEPIIRHMAYVFPDCGFEAVKDQFMLGNDLLVAPVVTKGSRRRVVKFPPGTWQGDDGSMVAGPCVEEVSAPLSRLPRYRRID
ncbi:MAG: glycoside hydrolase family 31 protein [Capsulimonadaceae bacterium]|nr:glycoside hydrolase family 31 protein [Capsulimonadaceae bacterium]